MRVDRNQVKLTPLQALTLALCPPRLDGFFAMRLQIAPLIRLALALHARND